MPTLIGLSVSEVNGLSSSGALSFSASTTPADDLAAFTTITSQVPAAGERVFPGSSVAYDFELDHIELPSIEGKPLQNALGDLKEHGLEGHAAFGILPVHESGKSGAGVATDVDPQVLSSAAEELGLEAAPPLTGTAFDLPPNLDVGTWTVVTSSPGPDETAVAGSEVLLTVRIPLAQVPNLTGMTYAAAQAAIHDAGLLRSSTFETAWSGELPPGFTPSLDELEASYWGYDEKDALAAGLGDSSTWSVLSQSVSPATLASPGSPLGVTLAWPSVTVPDLMRLPIDQAKQALNQAGLSSRGLGVVSSGSVLGQSTAPGTMVPYGSRVDVQAGHEVTFTVTGTSGTGLITWSAPGSFSIQQANDAALPWSTTFVRSSAPGAYERGTVSAQSDAWSGSITCEISVDGKVVQTRTSSGAFAVVLCG
ncbi:MmpS family transport accessory protein [Cnuibacter sp. UC19_7]|uniref:MmpS family transport accessory protein n=1 Tax=Cnuibacter sp. UC19_7 TaxID=3350166 RepID=UPI00367152C8